MGWLDNIFNTISRIFSPKKKDVSTTETKKQEDNYELVKTPRPKPNMPPPPKPPVSVRVKKPEPIKWDYVSEKIDDAGKKVDLLSTKISALKSNARRSEARMQSVEDVNRQLESTLVNRLTKPIPLFEISNAVDWKAYYMELLKGKAGREVVEQIIGQGVARDKVLRHRLVMDILIKYKLHGNNTEYNIRYQITGLLLEETHVLNFLNDLLYREVNLKHVVDLLKTAVESKGGKVNQYSASEIVSDVIITYVAVLPSFA